MGRGDSKMCLERSPLIASAEGRPPAAREVYHRRVSETISIDFSRPVALFPLGGTILLPHAPQALHLFEPRYRQMVEHCLDCMEGDNLLTAAPIAMATHGGPEWEGRRVGSPPLRPAVCVGKIVQHTALPDGRHNIILHGVCRGRIDAVIEPSGDRLYRLARITPLETLQRFPRLPSVRRRLQTLLDRPRLRRMSSADTVREWVARTDVPTHALVELVSFALLKDDELRYRLLEEPDLRRRARMLTDELRHIDRLVALADLQDREWPKGMSWN